MLTRAQKLRAFATPGDLLFYRLTPNSSLMAWAVAIFQALRKEGSRKNYYHVALLCRDCEHKIEAALPRIRKSEVDWNRADLELWRIRKTLPHQRAAMLAMAEHRVGEWYDVGQALGALFDFKGEICTTLVRKCANAAGLKIGQGAGKFISPNELADDRLIFRVG